MRRIVSQLRRATLDSMSHACEKQVLAVVERMISLVQLTSKKKPTPEGPLLASRV